MKILALDTSTPRGSVALLNGSQTLSELRICSQETHSARLLRSIHFLLQTAAWNLWDLNLIAAGIGPGSFTGIRIGLSTALGLSQTLGVPFAGISGLDALAHRGSFLEGRIGVMMDAQRGQVYYAEFLGKRGKVRRIQKAGIWYPSALKPNLARGRFYLIGDGALRYINELRNPEDRFPLLVEVDLFLAGSIGRLALTRRRAWRFGDGLGSDPLYIRPPDARRPEGRKR